MKLIMNKKKIYFAEITNIMTRHQLIVKNFHLKHIKH